MIARNRPIVSLFLAHLVTDLYMPVITAILPLLIYTRGYSYLMAGLLVTSYNLTSSATQPVFGWLSDRRGFQVPIAFSLIVSAVFIGLIGVVEPYPLLLICAAAAALGHACFHPQALTMVSRIATSVNRGRLTAFFVVGGNVGYAIGPILASAIVVRFGLSGLPLLILPALFIAIAMRNLIPRKETIPSPPEKSPGIPIGISTFRPVLTLFASSTLRAWAVFAAISFFPPLLVERGLDLFSANLWITLMLLAGVTGQIAGGTLADRYGKKEFVLLGLALSLPPFLAFYLGSGAASLVALLIFGFTLWSSFALTVAISHELMPEHVGMTSGLMLGVAIGAGGLGVALTGYIADEYSLMTALATIPVLIGGAALLMSRVRYPWKTFAGSEGE